MEFSLALFSLTLKSEDSLKTSVAFTLSSDSGGIRGQGRPGIRPRKLP
jgi:hypothetical protein